MGKNRVLKIFAVVIVLLIIAYIWVNSDFGWRFIQDQYWQTKVAEVQTRKQIWSDQKISKYKIGIRATAPLGCSQELLIDNNVPVEIMQNTCHGYVFFTVDALFAITEKIINEKACSPAGCECGRMAVNVIYDEQYKFPKKAKAYDDGGDWWWEFTNKVGGFSCSMKGYLYYPYQLLDYEIYSFIPIE